MKARILTRHLTPKRPKAKDIYVELEPPILARTSLYVIKTPGGEYELKDSPDTEKYRLEFYTSGKNSKPAMSLWMTIAEKDGLLKKLAKHRKGR